MIKPYELKNSVFIHIPKTGGSWVNKILFDTGLYLHLGSGHGNKTELNVSKNCFCFIRHPLSWIKSIWAFQEERIENDTDKKEYIDKIFYNIINGIDEVNNFCIPCFFHNDINIFIERIIKFNPGGVLKYFKYFTDGCEYIGKQENLCEDLIFYLKKTNENFDADLFRELNKNKINICARGKKIIINKNIEKAYLLDCKDFFEYYKLYNEGKK